VTCRRLSKKGKKDEWRCYTRIKYVQSMRKQININKTITNTFSEFQLIEFRGAVYYPEIRREREADH
jgi:hypothetical protein